MRIVIFQLCIATLFSIYVDCLYAQDISVELSLNEGKILDRRAPYLEIKYINSGHLDYYFPALLSRNWSQPHYSKSFPIPDIDDPEYVRQTLFEKRLFHGEYYQLLLNYVQERNPYGWLLLPKNAEDEHGALAINYFLYEYSRTFGDGDYLESFFKKSELSCSRKLRQNPSLVFLGAGESSTQLISIRDLKDAGIILLIDLSSNTPPNSMLLSIIPGDGYALPHTLRGYTLYQGIIRSNSLLLDFSGKN